MVEVEERLVKKSNCRSVIWNYFALNANEHGIPLSEQPICRSDCQKIVPAKGGNTSNLLTHLRDHITPITTR